MIPEDYDDDRKMSSSIPTNLKEMLELHKKTKGEDYPSQLSGENLL